MGIDRTSLTADEKRALLERLLRERARAASTDFSMSVGQRALWFIHESAPYNSAFHLILSYQIRGSLSAEALSRAVDLLVDRHPILRTRIDDSGSAPMHRFEGAKRPDLEVVDARDWSDADLDAAVEEAKVEPFALETGPLLRIRLFDRSADEHVLVVVMHHIIGDAVSMGVLLSELTSNYEVLQGGGSPRPHDNRATYADYVTWQDRFLASEDGDRQWTYWKNKLSGELPVLALAASTGSTERRYGTHLKSISGESVRALRELARKEGVTVPALLLATYYVLLFRYTGQTDILIGMPSLGRSRPEYQKTIGYFTDPVVLRGSISSDLPFREVLHAVRGEMADAMANQDFPFASIVERLRVPRSGSSTPVFQTMFNVMRVEGLQGIAGIQANAASANWTSTEMGQRTGQFDLELQVVDRTDSLDVTLGFSEAAIESQRAERMLEHYELLLSQFLEDPSLPIGKASILTAEERDRILFHWNETSRTYPSDLCVHDLIEQQAAATPDDVAVVDESTELTYAELERRSNQLARYLQSVGVGAETPVGICLHRSVDLVVGLLAILKAGGTYVPMDPAFPPHRLQHMQEAGKMPVLILEKSTASLVPSSEATRVVIDRDWSEVAAQADGPLDLAVDPGQSAYVIFTSGSTGVPKGVVIEHRALTNFLWSMKREPGLDRTDTLVSVTTLSFDIAALEIYLPLITGAKLVLASSETAVDGLRLSQMLEHHDATVLQGTPATWRMMLEAGWKGKPDLKMLCGGEALPASLAEQLLSSGKELWNMYGPTETTIWSSVAQIVSADDIHVGHPIDNTQMYVLDERLQPVPPGVAGTLYIGGDGVARGYLDQPALTQERFVANPFRADGSRIYDTGDRARYRNDGVLECLGRSDSQVKVRGFRIELGDVETAIENHPDVRQAVVVVTGEEAMARLAAFVVPEEGASVSAAELRAHAKTHLPDYMVPGSFVELEELPLTPNGKVDRKKLANSTHAAVREEVVYVAPRSELERTIADIWSEVLKLEKVGIHDDFFELGGHSLMATRVMARMRAALDVDLSLQVLFEAPTIADLAIHVAQSKSAAVDEARLLELLSQLDELSDDEVKSHLDVN